MVINANHAPRDNSLTQFKQKNKTKKVIVNFAAKEHNLSIAKQNAKSARLVNTKHPTLQPMHRVLIVGQENTFPMMARMLQNTTMKKKIVLTVDLAHYPCRVIVFVGIAHQGLKLQLVQILEQPNVSRASKVVFKTKQEKIHAKPAQPVTRSPLLASATVFPVSPENLTASRGHISVKSVRHPHFLKLLTERHHAMIALSAPYRTKVVLFV